MTYKEVLGSVAAQKIRSAGPANEVNWKSSMLFCQSLSDAIETYGTKELPSNFAGSIEPYVNSVLECAISERTQLSVQACRLTGNLSKVLGKDMHPLLDRILPVLIKHCASTKAVNQKSSAAAISNIITHSTYSPRLLWHICEAFEEKNVGPRLQAPGWLLLILKDYQKFLTSERDLDTIINSIHNGLVDADNNVRTKSRTLFWEYYKFDAEGAEELKTRLNNHAITALDNDPANPNKKATKAKAKEPTRPESSLAQMRQQAKKRLQEHAAAKPISASKPIETQTFEPASITSANFAFGELELNDTHSEPRSKKSVKDSSLSSTQQYLNNMLSQKDNHHISKPASRPISVHKKTASHESHAPSLNKKASAMEIGTQHLHKAKSTSEGLRTSQTKKSGSAITNSTATNEPSAPRSLLSGPVRRPRIVATPMHVAQPTSRPSSRAEHPQATVIANETSFKSAKESLSSVSQHNQKNDVEHNRTVEPSQPLQQIKTSRKALRQEIASPVLIPDGKENANIYQPGKSWTSQDGTPSQSHIQRVLDHATKTAEAAQQYIAKQDAAAAAQAEAVESEMKDARKALTTAIGLMTSGQMDIMGFRKFKNLVCNNTSELIDDKEQYDTLMEGLIARLGSVHELVYRGDTASLQHPTFVRQTVVHMLMHLLKAYHPAWREQYFGPVLATLMLARCAYSRNNAEFDGEQPIAGQPYMHRHSKTETIVDGMFEIVAICSAPLDVLDSMLTCISASENFILENSEELKPKLCGDTPSWRDAFASWDRYSKDNHLRNVHFNHMLLTRATTTFSPPTFLQNWDGFNESGPVLPSKLYFLMEMGMRLCTPLLIKARRLGQRLYPLQESMICNLAQHLLIAYNAVIRRYVMPFIEQVFLIVRHEPDFWIYVEREADRNLLHYYLADSKLVAEQENMTMSEVEEDM